MSVLLLLVGAGLLGAPAVLARWGQGMPPQEWCRVVVGCLWAGRLAVQAGLWFAFGPVVLAAGGAHELAHECHRMMVAGLPVPPESGWLAGAALVVLSWRSLSTRREVGRSLRVLRAESWFGEHRLDAGVEVVTLPSLAPLAYAVPGRPGQIAVTEGLVAGLDGDEMAAVLRHEQAHLRLGHHDALGLGAEIDAQFGLFPGVRRSVAQLRLGVERWADEDAASPSPEARPAVRRALLKTVALALGPVPAFTDAETIATRLDALSAPPPQPRWRNRVVTFGPMVALSSLGTAAVAACALVAHHGIDGLIGRCPFT